MMFGKRLSILILLTCAVSALYSQAMWKYLPEAKDGTVYRYPLDKKGRKYFEVRLLEVSYMDSTDINCKVFVKFKVKAVGKKISLADLKVLRASNSNLRAYAYNENGRDYSITQEEFSISTEIVPKDTSIIVNKTLWLNNNWANVLAYDGHNFARFPIYDGELLKQQREERKRMQEYETVMYRIKSSADNGTIIGESSIADGKEYCDTYKILTSDSLYTYTIVYDRDSNYVRNNVHTQARAEYERQIAEKEWWDEHGDEVMESARRKAYVPDFASYQVWLEFWRQEMLGR